MEVRITEMVNFEIFFFRVKKSSAAPLAVNCSLPPLGRWHLVTSTTIVPNEDSMDASFLASIPKTDLHIHLDGSLRLSTLIELSKAQGFELPSETEEGLQDAVFKHGKFSDLF